MFDYLIIYGNKHQFSMASGYAYVTEQLAIKKRNEFLNKTIDKELFYPNAIIKAVPFGTR